MDELKAYNEALPVVQRMILATTVDLSRLRKMPHKEEKEKLCINCHKYYHPRLNNDMACSYHPGKIKFYSCK
jgi:hypothetical protein